MLYIKWPNHGFSDQERNGKLNLSSYILLSILIILLIIFGSIFFWFFYSESRKRKIQEIEKEAKQIRKQILTKGYREVNELKLEFQREQEKKTHELELKKLKFQSDLTSLNEKEKRLDIRQKRLDGYELALEKRSKEYDQKVSQVIETLENISGMSSKEAKELLMKQVKNRTQKEIGSYLKNIELDTHAKAKMISNNIIIGAMERYTSEIVNERTTNIVKLPNDEIKGRIIGREGRNMRALEQYGGVEVIIDETPGIVTISSFNPIRREIATKTLEKLLVDGRIQPNKIELELKKQEKELDNIIFEVGQKTVQELGILGMDIELVKLVGKLKYRTSYGQSVLIHSLEVAKIAGMIAVELGLNIFQAIRAGLLHDIGKAVDFEQEGTHVTLGAELARKYNEDEVVINTIESHHEDVPKNSAIAAIVSIADTISASRPGARNNTIDDFFKRMNQIETICNNIAGVDHTYAFQSGRQIRIIIDPNVVGDSDMNDLLLTVKNEISKNVVVPGEVTITAIREKRVITIINK